MNEDRNPGDALARLTERLQEECAKAGLTLRQAAFLPNLEGGRHTLQALFTVEDDVERTDDDQAKYDATFEAMVLGQRAAERDDDVRRRLEKGMNLGGLLDDEDDEDDGDAS